MDNSVLSVPYWKEKDFYVLDAGRDNGTGFVTDTFGKTWVILFPLGKLDSTIFIMPSLCRLFLEPPPPQPSEKI
jgi:hypothetical protein